MASTGVIVVGAGTSGLQAALSLKKQGLSVVVVEARERVGGRTFSEPMGPNQVVDVGGQWVGPPQKRVNALLKRYKLALREQFDAGRHVLEDKGRVSHYGGGLSEMDVGAADLEATWKKLDALAAPIDVARPWTACGANEQDSITLRNWLQKNVPEEQTRKMVEWFARVCIAAEPSEFSLLYFLTWLKAGGLYASLANVKDGAQNHVVAGGMQQLSEAMAKELGEGTVQFATVVQKIVRKKAGVEVHVVRLGAGGARKSEVLHARRVVLAMSPPLTNKIELVPGASFERRQLCGSMAMGQVIKVLISFHRPFWRENGLSGEFISDAGPLAIGYDRSDEANNFFAIVGFCAGSAVKRWGALSESQRRDEVVAQLGRLFDHSAIASEVASYRDHDWTREEYSEGCYFSYMRPSAIIRFKDALSAPVSNRVFYAGTETAREWIGYIEGSLESGERVAAEIIRAEQAEKSKL